jgi:ChrR Cupin-like domain
MRNMTFEPARPLDTDGMPWIPTGPGKSFRPLRFAADGWSELMRLEPGSAVAVHRHTGDVHAFNLAGTREIFGTGERVGPGNYVYEPAGTLDGWEPSATSLAWCTSRSPAPSSTSATTARSSSP